MVDSQYGYNCEIFTDLRETQCLGVFGVVNFKFILKQKIFNGPI